MVEQAPHEDQVTAAQKKVSGREFGNERRRGFGLPGGPIPERRDGTKHDAVAWRMMRPPRQDGPLDFSRDKTQFQGTLW